MNRKQIDRLVRTLKRAFVAYLSDVEAEDLARHVAQPFVFPALDDDDLSLTMKQVVSETVRDRRRRGRGGRWVPWGNLTLRQVEQIIADGARAYEEFLQSTGFVRRLWRGRG